MLSTRLYITETPTAKNFDEDGYLAANPDVATAVRTGSFPSGRLHFDMFGQRERRQQTALYRRDAIAALRAEKLACLEPLLRDDLPRKEVEGRLDFLTPELRDLAGLKPTDNVSANSYDGDLWSLIDETESGLILDCGAGYRDVYISNVVNYEVMPYLTTDVLGVGEELPFTNGAFSGIISVAVLEHVRDPFKCAKELCRVLKPGGWIFCSVPFLQPYHGYPRHYFNMTHDGVRALLGPAIQVDRQYLNSAMLPIWSLRWIVSSWANGLDPESKKTFLELRLEDFIGDVESHLDQTYVTSLTEEKNFELACATILIGRRSSD